ncbi:hypothetical protein ACPA9J_20565 [Pseudomonas aeruginosa]
MSARRASAGGEAAGLPATAHPLPQPTQPCAPQQHVIVTVTSEPAPLPGHRWPRRLPRQACRSAGRSPCPAGVNLDRGTHQVAVEIIDGDGYDRRKHLRARPFHRIE